jgi:5S rRNA maturation endonuclease (ribonuclease M5)
VFTSKEEIRAIIEKKRDLLTICEGKRDLIALRKLGFTNLRELDGPLYKVVEAVEKGETIQLLVDFDREGRKLYAALSSDFLQRGVRIDNELRHALFKTGLQHIEGLDSFLEN